MAARRPGLMAGKLITFARFTAVAPLAAASAARTRRAFLAGAGNIDGQGAALKLLVVELLDGFLRLFGRGKFHKGKAARLARDFVHHEIHRSHRSGLGEVFLKVVFPRLIREISYKQSALAHKQLTGQITKWEDCIGRITECRFSISV